MNGPVRYHYAFGLAGRAGGIHDVSHHLTASNYRKVSEWFCSNFPLIAVESYYRRQLWDHSALHRNHCLCPTVVKDEYLTFFGKSRINRHIGRTALENSEFSHYQFHGAF